MKDDFVKQKEKHFINDRNSAKFTHIIKCFFSELQQMIHQFSGLIYLVSSHQISK